MSDYLLSVKLLVQRLRLNYEPRPVPSRTTINYLESTNCVDVSHDNRNNPDDELTDKIEYRRKRHPKCPGRTYDVSDHSSNKITDPVSRDVFQYPSVHVNKCEYCKHINDTTTRSSSSPQEEMTCSCSEALAMKIELDQESRRSSSTISPYIRLSSATYDSKESDVYATLIISPSNLPGLGPTTINEPDIITQTDRSPTSAPRYSPSTPNTSGSCLEIPLEQGHNSPLFWESNRLSQVSSLGVSSNRSSRSSSVGSSKPRLSVSKSVPLSPQPVTKETRQRQLCGIQLKLDTLKAELMALGKSKQELACQLLQLYSEIQIQKVKRSCMKHCELLDEAIYEAEIADELPTMLDAPYRSQSKLLTYHGVTSFNIACRRFSCS